MTAKKKQAPCSQWMHHKWLPSKGDILKEQNLIVGSIAMKQVCKFCGDKRAIVLVAKKEKNEGEE